jgi:hypothetical protein
LSNTCVVIIIIFTFGVFIYFIGLIFMLSVASAFSAY